MAEVLISILFLVGVIALVIFGGDKNATYPPKDERGRPMKDCFGSRGTPFRWVRDAD